MEVSRTSPEPRPPFPQPASRIRPGEARTSRGVVRRRPSLLSPGPRRTPALVLPQMDGEGHLGLTGTAVHQAPRRTSAEQRPLRLPGPKFHSHAEIKSDDPGDDPPAVPSAHGGIGAASSRLPWHTPPRRRHAESPGLATGLALSISISWLTRKTSPIGRFLVPLPSFLAPAL
jgi:hypothetical protein